EERLLLARNLVWFWNTRGHTSEGRAALERALEEASSAPRELRATALDRLADLAVTLGDFALAQTVAKESLKMARSLGDDHRVAEALDSLALCAFLKREF